MADNPPQPRRAAHDLVTAAFLIVAALLPAPAFAQSGQIVEYYHLDALGSVRVVTDQNAQVVARHDFLPFGEEWNPPPNAKEKKLFTGHERDAETGLDYFGARYYRPQVGRFTTIDPLQATAENLVDPQRWDRYAYARNNPLRWVDPDGRSIWSKVGKALVKALKTGNAAAAFAADIANIQTVCDGDAIVVDRIWAAAELATELLPVSIDDAETAVRWATRATDARDSITVIGRTRDLANLAPGERSLLHRLPDLGDAKSNWKQNAGVLREEMRRGMPIRDASPRDTTGPFLNAERNLLRDRGWTFDSRTNYWMPPKS